MLDRSVRSAFVQQHPNSIFWLCFGLLNLLLFLPHYLLSDETTSIFPPASIANNGLWLGINQLLLWRDNLDPIRLSLEFTLLSALWVNLRWVRHPLVCGLTVMLYLLAFSYAIYEAIMRSLYQSEPVYSQYYLARDGIPFLLQEVGAAWWLGIVAVFGIVLLLTILGWLVNLLLTCATSSTLRRATRTAITVLVCFCLLTAVHYQTWTAKTEMVVSSLGYKLNQNITTSLELYRDIASFDDHAVQAAYDYSDQHLTTKPNIYFLLVESYGSVLYKRPDYRLAYTSLLMQLEDQLTTAGWHSTTALSNSPMWGGGSWMAYSTVLLGLRIDNQPQYLSLFNKYQVDTYPGLGRTLKAQGYDYIWLSSIRNQLAEGDWAKQLRFHGADEARIFADFDYHGPSYGWGDAPPDQYVLSYAREQFVETSDQPKLIFMITQNSHYPWLPQPELADDWRTLNDTGMNDAGMNEVEIAALDVDTKALDHATTRQNYLRAIDYQLRMLTQFILSTADENSIYVLIGDHQPPRVSRKEDGWGTPVHVISKDAALIDGFAAYGFIPGLLVKSYKPNVNHEGIYSLFMRTLLERYGDTQVALPAYLPNGVTVEQSAAVSR